MQDSKVNGETEFDAEFNIERLKKAVAERVPLDSPYSVVGSRARAVIFASKSLAVYLGMEKLKALKLARAAAEIGSESRGTTEPERAVVRENKLATKAMTAGRIYLFAADSKGGGVFIPLSDRTACHLMALGRLPQAAKVALKEAGLVLSAGPVGAIEPYVFSQELSSEALERMAKRYRDLGDDEMECYTQMMRLGWQAAAPEVAVKPSKN